LAHIYQYISVIMTHERLAMLDPGSDYEESKASEKVTPFQHSDLLRHIISYVGEKQYRFVAAISKDFQAAYLESFRYDTQTYYNALTIKHAMISMEDETVDHSETSILCTSAARH
jgi:hypothetical protein